MGDLDGGDSDDLPIDSVRSFDWLFYAPLAQACVTCIFLLPEIEIGSFSFFKTPLKLRCKSSTFS
jgi:hypothetical protein